MKKLSLPAILSAFLFFSAVSPAAAAPSSKNKGALSVRIIGIAVVGVGGYLIYQQRTRALEKYESYQHSAFTQNTNSFRSEVENHQRNMAIAGVLAGIGGLMIVLSF